SDVVAVHRAHFVADSIADLRPARRDAVPVDDPGADRHHLLEHRSGLAGSGLDDFAILAVEQPQQGPRRPLHQTMEPGDPGILAFGMLVELALSVVLELEEFEHP